MSLSQEVHRETMQNWFAFCHLRGLGAVNIQKLVSYFGGFQHLLEASFAELKSCGLSESLCRQVKNLPESRKSDRFRRYMDQLLEWQQEDLQSTLALIDPDYPPLLKETVGPPPVLYVRGHQAALQKRSIAIVGSRKPSHSGRENGLKFGRELAACGFGVVSGLALGVDVEAHRGALDADGVTIAVLGTGVDNIYPKKHRPIAETIIEKRGAIISEMPLGAPAKPENFPRRNRIISGLSAGVLVVEAALKSGSLISAQYAVEQNKDVFAIPGSIKSTLSQGCHALIKQGAKLTESVEDILEEVGGELGPFVPNIGVPKSKDLGRGGDSGLVLEALGWDAVDSDQLCERTGLSVATLSAALLELELEGKIGVSAGSYQRIK